MIGETAGADTFWRLTPTLENTSSRLVTVMNADGALRYLSPPFCALLSLPSSFPPFGDTSLLALLHSASKELAETALARMAEKSERFALWRLRFEGQKGHLHWLEGRASNFLDDPRLGGIVAYWTELAG